MTTAFNVFGSNGGTGDAIYDSADTSDLNLDADLYTSSSELLLEGLSLLRHSYCMNTVYFF